MSEHHDHSTHTAAVLPTKLVGSIVQLSPTTASRWLRCRRQYLLRNVLQLPSIDRGPGADEGLMVHALLRRLHETGSCATRASIEGIVEDYGGRDPDRLRAFLERHARRCPRGAEPLGHELGVSRFHRGPPPAFLASASIDAVWIHDGLLDVRDYKTGNPWTSDLVDDVRARVQAWTLAPVAAVRGLRLRIRYEFLGPEVPEDPPPFDPEPEQLDAIEEELRSIADAIRTEREFVGVAEPAVCTHCEYRSVCVDVAGGTTTDENDEGDSGR